MPAWAITQFWPGQYPAYRASASRRAPQNEHDTRDCADLSMWLLINFASWHGLPVAITDNDDTEYASWSDGWQDRFDYFRMIQRRIGARALFLKNTVQNPNGPEPGDLLLRQDHAAVIFAVYASGTPNPRAADQRIRDFPGPEAAASEHNVTQYIRSRSSEGVRVDYLNHRGHDKQAAELIFNAPLTEMLQQGLEIRQYSPRVLRHPDAAPRRGSTWWFS